MKQQNLGLCVSFVIAVHVWTEKYLDQSKKGKRGIEKDERVPEIRRFEHPSLWCINFLESNAVRLRLGCHVWDRVDKNLHAVAKVGTLLVRVVDIAGESSKSTKGSRGRGEAATWGSLTLQDIPVDSLLLCKPAEVACRCAKRVLLLTSIAKRSHMPVATS